MRKPTQERVRAAEAEQPPRADTLRDTRGIPRLTPAEEREIGRALRRARRAERKLARRGLPRQERWQLRRAVQAGREARERLVLGNLGLVHSMIRQRYRGLMPYEDLVHEGVLGLCQAADRWDGKRRYSTFATWQIRGALTDAVRERARLVRLPADDEARAYRLRQIVRQISEQIGRHPSADEVAQAAGMTRQDVQAAWQGQRVVLSLDAEDPTTGGSLGDVIPVDGDVEGQAARDAGVVNVEAFIAGLPKPAWRMEAMVMAGLTADSAQLSVERRRTREDLRRYLAQPARAKHLVALAGSIELALGLRAEREKGGGNSGQ